MFKVSLVDLTENRREFRFRVPKERPLFKSQLGHFSTDIDVRGELVKRDENFFTIHLEVVTDVEVPCRRCLTICSSTIRLERELYVKRSADCEEDPDLDFIPIGSDDREVDIEKPLRELVVLGFPNYPLCDDDCKGLCPHCGQDLNAARCNCKSESTDPRWDVLRGLLDKNSEQ